MKRISFNWTFHTKVFPWIVAVFAGVMTFRHFREAEWLAELPSVVGPTLLGLVGAIVGAAILFYFALVFRLHARMEKVFDAGDSLVVIHRGVRTDIPLEMIKRVSCSTWPNPTVVVRLVESFDLGREFKFMPIRSVGMLPKYCSALNERALRARALAFPEALPVLDGSDPG